MKRIKIQETIDFDIKDVASKDVTIVSESANPKEKPTKITTIVEAIHSGLTRNYTFYPAQHLEKSVDSWITPYSKPVIKNHDIYEEPLGRVKSAEFKQSQIAHDKHTIQLSLEITDPETIQKVMDGRYQTLSIGGTTSSAICSICGKDLVKEGYCGHMKGRVYDGKKAHWIIGEMSFDEISFVNVPADSNAQVIMPHLQDPEDHPKDPPRDPKDRPKESNSSEGGDEMPTGENVDQHSEDILDQIDSLRESASDEDPEQQTEGSEDPTTQEENTDETNTDETDPEQQAEGDENSEDNSDDVSLEKQVEQLSEEVTRLKDEAKDNLDQITLLSTERDTLQEQADEAQKEIDQLKEELQVANSENKASIKQNINLATYIHKALAESHVNLQIVLGKVSEEERETKIAELAKQSTRTLQEEINQLIKEKPARIIAKVDQTGNVAGVNDEVEGVRESANGDKETEVTLEILAEKLSKAINKKYSYED